MNIPFFVLLGLTFVAGIIAYRFNLLNEGIKASVSMFFQLIPVLMVAFVLAGIMQVFIPREFIKSLLGKDTGIKGIVIGALVGIVMPGGPYVSFPILAVFYKGGASMGAMAALLSSWGLIGLFRFVTFEVPILGAHFAFARYISSFMFPIAIGYITELIFGK